MGNKKKTTALIKVIQKMKMKNGGVITFYFLDDSKQSINVNPKVFKDENGNDESYTNIIKKFNTQQHDLGAIKYIIN